MRNIILCLSIAAVLTFAGCGSTTVMTPEFIDPSDSLSSESSEQVSGPSGQVSVTRPDTPPAPSSEETSEPTSEEISEPSLPQIEVTTVSTDQLLWDDGLLSCTRHTMIYGAGELADAGSLTYDYLQITSDTAAEAFNTHWKADMVEWELSVQSTVRYCAESALENGGSIEQYRIELPAEVFRRGGVISVRREAVQHNGDRTFSFVSNRCFDETTGRELTLWELFTVPEEEIAPRILEALNIQAEVEGRTGLDAASLFAPTDFSLSEGGFVFSLTAADGITDLTIPYENFMNILAYPLLG